MPTAPPDPITNARIFRIWLPLAATWLMMSVEGPFLAALIARLPEPRINLAAYGVAFAFATICESPIIMMLSAATALVRDMDSYRKLRNFAFSLNLAVTLVMIVVLLPPIFDRVTLGLIGLPENVAHLTHRSLLLLLPWPAAIGFRRFYQGLLIRQELTRRVATGTIIRVVGMTGGALILYHGIDLPGAMVGAGALATGVVLEAVGTRLMAWGVKERVAAAAPLEPLEPLTLRRIVEFYFPLALTSTIALAVQPMETFFLGGSRRALDSLAIMPVVTSFTFIFRSAALSYQEVAITLLDGTRENFRKIARFALTIGVVSTSLLVGIAMSPLSGIWFRSVSGLSAELTEFSVFPLRLVSVIPMFSVLIAFQRAILVFGRKTRPITGATVVEVTTIVAMLFLTIRVFDFVGAVAAVVSLLVGRLLGNLYLLVPCRIVLASTGILPGNEAGASSTPLLDTPNAE
jgi:progressive ankylosis protein